jgi:hypothetical protein
VPSSSRVRSTDRPTALRTTKSFGFAISLDATSASGERSNSSRSFANHTGSEK